MNEGQKTGLFCVIGAVMLAIGLFVSWPDSPTGETSIAAGKPLFPSFKDPLAAASVKIVSFDEAQGQVDTFEVRKDRESGLWTIPSRKGYPADAVEQMKDAANALVGLQILDVQTSNPEDHVALGVVEPKLEVLEAGDIGVGRLVTFRDESQKDLASLIIGEPVKDEEGRRYVRKPGQDPVYVVELDEAALSTKFQVWIENDLLQLSSIDIKSMRMEDYAASMTARGFSLDRNYTAEVLADGSDWKLEQLLEYPSDDPLADPVEVKVGADQVVNKEKLNDLKNALDDLKIVDVARKPEGMSANLRADKDLVSDNEAVTSLATRGFFPVQRGTGSEVEVLSANGELDVTLADGVQYVLRFGNVFGLADEDSGDIEDESSDTAVNRYLLVTARVDESQFPAPELSVVPQTIEELAAMLDESASGEGQDKESGQAESGETADEAADETEMTESASAEPVDSGETPAETAEPAEAATGEEMTPAEEPAADEPAAEEPAEMNDAGDGEQPATAEDAPESETPADESETPADEGETPADEGETPAEADEAMPAEQAESSEDAPAAGEKPADSGDSAAESEDSDSETSATEEVEVEGSGEATGEGQGQAADDATATETADEPAESGDTTPEPAAAATAAPESGDNESGELAFADLTQEEKVERLEAEQEKILKANTRLLDARKDRLNAAKRRVSDLNARFADWYYVIPEATYRELRISRDELLTAPESAAAATPPAGQGGPSMPFQIPGLNAPR